MISSFYRSSRAVSSWGLNPKRKISCVILLFGKMILKAQNGPEGRGKGGGCEDNTGQLLFTHELYPILIHRLKSVETASTSHSFTYFYVDD